MTSIHKPALLEETLKYLINTREGVYLDCTLGTGGHFKALANSLKPNAILIGLDADPSAIDYCKQNIQIQQKSIFVNSNFADLKRTCFRIGYTRINGIFMDLGLSSFALDNPNRGFSYNHDGPLDMRFSPETTENAEAFINSAPVSTLNRVFKEYGEEKHSNLITKAIDRERKSQQIKTTQQLANIITNSISSPFPIKIISRIFQAIRIYVNKEIESLKKALSQSLNILDKNGRLVVISYHSIEDRIVKQFMKLESTDCICPPDFPICQCNHKAKLEILTKGPITPSIEEISNNSRARGAKLRASKKITRDK